MQLELSGFDLRHIEHVVDQAEQVLAASVDVLDIGHVAAGREGPEGSLPHHVGEADDGVQGRAQLVAHIGEKTAFGAVGGFGGGLGLGQFGLVAALIGDVGHGADGARRRAVVAEQDAPLHDHDALFAGVGAEDTQFLVLRAESFAGRTSG